MIIDKIKLIGTLGICIASFAFGYSTATDRAEAKLAEITKDLLAKEKEARNAEQIQAQKALEAMDRIATYERSTAVLLDRVRNSNSKLGADAGSAEAKDSAELTECRRLLVRGAEVVEQCSRILGRSTLN